MSRWAGKVAVVTGASSGIGQAISKALIKEGLTVVGLARRKEKMEADMKNVKGKGKFYAVPCDVTDTKNVAEAFQWIKKNVGVVQIMINNAGLVTHGTLYETSRKDWEKVFNVNIMGMLECTKQAVAMMKEANVEGHIVNMNSMLGHRVMNMGEFKYNVYAGTKHAVTGLSETMQIEVDSPKIRVTSISPGFVKTSIMEANNVELDLSKIPALEPEDIADAIVYAIGTPQRVRVKELTIAPMGEF